jgi:hypothetical protein
MTNRCPLLFIIAKVWETIFLYKIVEKISTTTTKAWETKSMQKCHLSYKAERQILSLGKQNDPYTQSPQLGSSHTSVPTGNASFHSIDCQHSNKSSMNMEEQH